LPLGGNPKGRSAGPMLDYLQRPILTREGVARTPAPQEAGGRAPPHQAPHEIPST
jgi:hypothetical protein